MHRTQIYFEEDFFQLLKEEAARAGLSVSAYIRRALKKELQEKKHQRAPRDFSHFAGMWEDRDIDLKQIRKQAWKR